METELIQEEPSHQKGRHRKKQLYKSILQQMEFYFSDSNLAKDRFLSQLMQTNPDIEISVFLKFNKLRKLTTSIEDITKAVSKSQLIQLSDDKTKIRRKLPVKVKQDVDDCTIYVERLKSDATHDWLKTIFMEFGNVVYVSIPKYKHNGMIKGFAFVEFENPEGAHTAMQYFESIDCTIPSDIEPQKLCSIATFTPNMEGENTNRIIVKVQEFNEQVEEAMNIKSEVKEEPVEEKQLIELQKKRKHRETSEESSEVDMKKVKIEEEETVEEVVPQKKKKHKEISEESSEKDMKKVKIEEEETIEEVEPQKKKKHRETSEESNEVDMEEVKIEEEETIEVVPQKKKKHRETSEGEIQKVKIEEEETIEEVVPQKKKRKHSENEAQGGLDGEKKKIKVEEGEDEAAEPTDPVLPEATASDGEGEEKKKKKHKKSNRKKINLKEIGLQILCKKDWKKMRNRYLEMQRKTMKQLKMHLNRQRFSNRYGNKKLPHQVEKNSEVVKENNPIEESSQFIPGTIVKVSLLEPCENNKKLKTEFKDLPHEIKYVDIPLKFGSEEIFVRFSDNANAQAFCASSFSKGKPSILEGDEEKTYWEKIEESRQDKLKKCFGKQRGRDKLLKKAERQAAKHVRFDDSE